METKTEAIWQQPLSVEGLNQFGRGSMGEHLGIVFVEVGPDFLRATMPVDARTKQPFGLLHGGASVALAETLGSVAAYCCVDADAKVCVGLEVNANHVRAVREGHVTGTVRPVHLGRGTHVWQIHIHDEAGRLACLSRITMAVLDR